MLRKTQIFLIALSTLLAMAIIIIVITRMVNPSSSNTDSQIAPIQNPTSSVLMESPTTTAEKVKSLILPKLPIEIHDFSTSVGIITNIIISSYDSDSPEMIRLEIYGLDYQYNQNDPNTNPNMIAFKESFEKAMSVLSENKVDIRDLHISLGHKQYIRDIAETWITTLHLLP